MAKQYELARLDEAREGALIQVIDSAVVPGAQVVATTCFDGGHSRSRGAYIDDALPLVEQARIEAICWLIDDLNNPIVESSALHSVSLALLSSRCFLRLHL